MAHHEHTKSGLTSTMEDYIEAIAMIKRDGRVVRVKDISEYLNVKPSSVHSAISNLKKRNYVVHERYGYIDLTTKGEREASDVIRRHEILRSFLAEVIGIDRRVADRDACIMEHSLSPVTTRKLTKFVEFVQKCPKHEKPEWLRRFDHYCETGKCGKAQKL